MALDQKTLDEIVAKTMANLDASGRAKDLDQMVSLYHPDGVIVMKGQWVAYGREQIAAKFKEFLAMDMPKFKNEALETQQTGNGEFIVLKAVYYPEGKPEEKKPFEQILRRTENGQYLIFHDQFEV